LFSKTHQGPKLSSFNVGLTLKPTFYPGLATPRHQSRRSFFVTLWSASRSRKHIPFQHISNLPSVSAK